VTPEQARIAVIIPTYNEETQIEQVLTTLPDYVDDIVVVDDASSDATIEVVEKCATDDPRITLLALEKNRGVGGALSAGYLWAVAEDVDAAVVVAGDGQMDPDEMVDILEPILSGRADYTKGNRLTEPSAWKQIPRIRLFGNSVLSLLTKIVTGYWSVADFQSGYTGASRYALQNIDWARLYPRYGFPNDVLVHANIAECRVADVPITPIYGVGERSSMKVVKVIFTIAMLLFRRFWWRLSTKYVLRDFHPLVFFYLLATFTAVGSVALTGRLIWLWVAQGSVPEMTALALSFFAVTTLNSTFFAFWMDKESNNDLVVAAARPGSRQFDRDATHDAGEITPRSLT
jgi:glycosyltransferase involved in cell wall biosynthesis